MSDYTNMKEEYREPLGTYFTWYCKTENIWILEHNDNEYIFELEYDRDVFVDAISKAIIV